MSLSAVAARGRLDPEAIALLDRAAALARMLRRGESRQTALAAERRRVLVELRDLGVSSEEVGEYLGVRADSVRRIVRGAHR